MVAFSFLNQFAYHAYFPQIQRYLALSPEFVVYAIYFWRVLVISRRWNTQTEVTQLQTVNKEKSE